MKKFRELVALLAVCAVAVVADSVNKTNKKDLLYHYDDYDTPDHQDEVLFSEDKPCPRDCICTVSQRYRIAKCSRLEVGTQKFGDDITDLVIENADPRFPIQLDDFIFRKLGLHQVATVKIVNSTIGYISPKAFHGLNELYAVNLSNNQLKTLHPETFANNKNLLLLTLSNNPIKFPALGTDAYFLNASSVQELDISYCNIQYITTSMFNEMTGLMYLNLAGNMLMELDPDVFKKLLDLEELDLSDNKINSLPDDIFAKNTELATLHIQRNPVDTVYGWQIPDLLTLNAGQTNIKFVGPSMFNGMTYIANLNLSSNNIEKIHNQAFHKLVEMNYLDLSYNNLDFISSILIKENLELDIFKISNNPRLKHLPENGFECSTEQFNIYLFDASNCGLEEISDNALSTFTALTQINLSGNKIKMLSPKVFSRSFKLIEINLANNFITTLDAKVFEKNTELNKLNLQGNPLKVLSAETFKFTPALTRLDVSHTQLTSLWKDNKNLPATLLKNVRYLNISHSRITEIKKADLESCASLKVLDINYNPLACSREFENLMTWLSEKKISPNSNAASIANLAVDAKNDDTTYSWEFLATKTCGGAQTHPVEPLPPSVSDEEIWERIDTDGEGNFDLKDTLDDGKVADDNKLPDPKDPKAKKTTTDDDEYDSMSDDYDNSTDDDDADEEEDDDAAEEIDDGDDNIDLKVTLNEKPRQKTYASKPTTAAPKQETVQIDIKLTENDENADDEDVFVQAAIEEGEHGRYDYMWPIIIAVLGVLLVMLAIGKIVMMMCSRRDQQIRYNSAIIAAMGQQGRTKKDCGLVYQQLSEELGPATPKLSRYAPLHSITVASNLSLEATPFHQNVQPEAV